MLTMLTEMGASTLVEALVRKYGSLNAASRKADIPVATLSRIQSGARPDPRLSTLQRLADALGMPLHEAVKLMGTRDELPEAV